MASAVHPPRFAIPYTIPSKDVCCVASTDEHVFLGTTAGMVYVYDTEKRDPLRTIQAHPGLGGIRSIQCVQAHERGRRSSSTCHLIILHGAGVSVWPADPTKHMQPVCTFPVPHAVSIVDIRGEEKAIVLPDGRMRLMTRVHAPRRGWRLRTSTSHRAAPRAETVACARTTEKAWLLTGSTSKSAPGMAHVCGTLSGRIYATHIGGNSSPTLIPALCEKGDAVVSLAENSTALLAAFSSGSVRCMTTRAAWKTELPDYCPLTACPTPDRRDFIVFTIQRTGWIVSVQEERVHDRCMYMGDDAPACVFSSTNLLTVGPGARLLVWPTPGSLRKTKKLVHRLRPRDESAVSTSFAVTCRICMDAQWDHAMLGCGHVACTTCIEDLQFQSKRTKPGSEKRLLVCPFCRCACTGVVAVHP